MANVYFQSTIEQWRAVFEISLALSLVRTTIHLIWASAKVQPWNSPVKQDQHETSKLTNTTQNGTMTVALNGIK